MRASSKLKGLIVQLAALAFVGAAAAACGSASAASVPYTDSSAAGYIGLCNAAGQQITSGNIDTLPFVARAVSSVAAQAPYDNAGRTAVLLAFQPQQGLLPTEWSGSQLTSSSAYSNPAHPMAEATRKDFSLEDFLQEYPATWDGFVQLRMYLQTRNAEIYSFRYPALNIEVNGDTWTALGGGTVNCRGGEAKSVETLLPPVTSAYGRTPVGATGSGSTPVGATGSGPGGAGPSSLLSSADSPQCSRHKHPATHPRRGPPAPSTGRSSVMNSLIRRTLSLSVGAAICATLATGAASGLAGAAPARPGAADNPSVTAPPWEPDPDSVGALTFYNSLGTAVTGGNVTDNPIAAYIEGSQTIQAGDTEATLYGCTPVPDEPTSEWSCAQLSDKSAYPNTNAPSPLNGSTLPLYSASSSDLNFPIEQLENQFPQNSSVTGYVGMYQLRLRTSEPGTGQIATYDSADILVSGTGDTATWSVYYSAQATTTTLTATPTSAVKDQEVTLTATVTAGVAGSVQFYDGATALGSPIPVSNGTAKYSTEALPVGTADALTATFTPTNSIYAVSTSAVVDVKITNPTATATTLKASASSITEGQDLTLTATETPATTGSVTFFDNGKQVAVVTVLTKGAYEYASTKYASGAQSFTAEFKPTSLDFADSTSKAVDVTVKRSTKTSLKASASTITHGQNLVLTATESPYTAGSISFYDGRTRLAVVKVSSKGVAEYSSTKYAVGSQSFTASFAPTASASWAASTSTSVKVTVKS